MKIVLLAAASCIHTTRWANGLASRGIEVHLVSIHRLTHDLDSRVTSHVLPVKAPWGYVFAASALKKVLVDISPDLVNVHYASGYGFLARLAAVKPLLLSVWGSDVYEFPSISFLHRWILRGNLKHASAIASTSHCMAIQTARTFDHRRTFITPFGVDETLFCPAGKRADQPGLVIGTVKSLKFLYGVDTLIEAFALATRAVDGEIPLFLEISGDGPDRPQLEALAEKLGVADKVIFHGFVPHGDIPAMLNRMDIYVALSRSESFGVAILEASACEKPVVVSDADGPAEVTVQGKTGFIVPKENAVSASEALVTLARDADMRKRMGMAGRVHVSQYYTWSKSLDVMLSVYKKLIEQPL